jgi:GWxTD domain-containing protein
MLFGLLGFTVLYGQERYIEIIQKYGRPQFFFEVQGFPTAQTDSLKLLGTVRLSYDNSYFVRTADGKYSSELFFTIEILQRNSSVARKILKRTAIADSASVTKDRNKFVEVAFEVPLKTGDYDIQTEIYNNDLQKTVRIDRRKLALGKDRNFTTLSISEPVFVYKPKTFTKDALVSLRPLSASGNGLFGEKFVAAIELITGANAIDSLSYELYQKNGDALGKLIDSQPIDLTSLVPIDGLRASDETAAYQAKPLPGSKTFLALVDFGANKLGNARFVLRVIAHAGGKSGQLEKTFENSWVGMPYPLYDIDLSIKLMEGIMVSPQEAETMQNGSSEERRQKFLTFWKEKDPTPETEYNEALAEFYVRVDYAFFNFYTNREFGWRTDRGKTYIRYGKPTSIERDFPKNRSPRETWVYTSLNRRFIFSDITNSGNFQLTSEE